MFLYLRHISGKWCTPCTAYVRNLPLAPFTADFALPSIHLFILLGSHNPLALVRTYEYRYDSSVESVWKVEGKKTAKHCFLG